MSNRTRAEHIAWCKERAHAEYDYYRQHKPEEAVRNALASMISDLGKHPETAKMEWAILLGLQVHDERTLFVFIDGFN